MLTTQKKYRILTVAVIVCLLFTLFPCLSSASTTSEKESNDTIETAQSITVNNGVTGNISSYYDKDYYQFTLKSAGYINVDFSHPSIGSASNYWKITILDKNSQSLGSYRSNGNTTEKTENEIGLPAGTYYALVEKATMFSKESYTLTVKYTKTNAWEKEFNDSFDTSNLISTNQDVSGNLSSSSDHDYYAFTLDSEGYINLDFRHTYLDSSSNYWKITIFNSDDQTLASYKSLGNEAVKTEDELMLPAGTYYVRVESATLFSNATYTLMIKYSSAESSSFQDVSPSDYFYDSVQWAVRNNVTTGTSPTTFSPNQACSRAQVVTFLWRANGSPLVSSANPFTDISRDYYYYDAVMWAISNGITTGTSSNTFSPDQYCTRGQVVTFLWRMHGEPLAAGLNQFNDVSISDYYYRPVVWAVKNNITQGTSSNTFSPNQECTRAQVVTFLHRDLG